MILKQPGNYKIHRLRVIHLYEADYNLILSVKWRQIAHQANDRRLINAGQYGASRAHDPVFIEEMEYEISRASRRPLIRFDNDATSCYDRILPSIASIVSRKYGASRNLALVFATTLEEAKYKLKTMLGISESSYSHNNLTPLYGTGQGSGNSPVIWLLISNELFNCYETKAHGAKFCSPDKQEEITIYMIGFVDDTSGCGNLFDTAAQPTVSQLLDMMEEDAQVWNDLLWISGGDLERTKCSYLVIAWDFNAGIPQMKPGKIGRDIHIRSAGGNQKQIKSLSAYTAHTTLGPYKAPSENQTKQKNAIADKCKKAAILVSSCPLDRNSTWTYYFSHFLSSVPGRLHPTKLLL